MARAAVAAGADGLLIEVHNDPDHALSDGAQSLEPAAIRPAHERTPHHRPSHRPADRLNKCRYLIQSSRFLARSHALTVTPNGARQIFLLKRSSCDIVAPASARRILA